MKNILLIPFILGCALSTSFSQPVTFSYTGALQNYTVTACVYSITVDAKGAEGAVSTSPSATTPGKGGRVQATIAVTPGEILNISVGEKPTSNDGGWNGGGNGGAGGSDVGGGGGASDIRQGGTALSNRTIVSGGGGGAGYDLANGVVFFGGKGGGPNNAGNGGDATEGGKGGTETAGGAGGSSGANGLPGTLGTGGNGGGPYGAGGGGGYYGGGGGGENTTFLHGGGGGGGSSYTIITASSVTHTQGFQTGNGQIIITPIVSTTGPATPDTIAGNASPGAHSVETYSINAVPTATTYTWTVPSGSTIDSGQGTTSIVVTFGDSSGNISVTAGNACGTSAPDTLAITVTPTGGLDDQLTISKEQLRLTVYPLPVNDLLHLIFESPVHGAVRIETVDLLGRIIGEVRDVVEHKSGQYTINARTYPTGFYLVRVIQGNAALSKAFQVVR